MARSCLLCLLYWLMSQSLEHCAFAQTIQFPATAPNAPLSTGSPFGTAPTIPPPSFGNPGAQLSTPSFTPPSLSTPNFNTPSFSTPNFGTPNFGAANPSGAITPPPGIGSANPFGSPTQFGNATPWSSPPPASSPSSLYPGSGNWNPFAPPPNAYGLPQGGAYGNGGPNTLFPNGLWGPNAASGNPNSFGEPFRFLQHPRLSETYLYGSNHTNDVAINDIEVAITGALPNFLISTQPVYITPTFVMHLWDGPRGIAADLPANAYSAFLDTFWASDPDRPLGAEVGVSVGVFSDFNTYNTHSLRVMGEGFGVARLTPTLTMKLGVWYLNRNDLKLLPAGGLVWQPSPQMKFDILFPNPKLSRYLTTVGNSDVWMYVSGEYGGGAWTIQRADGSSDRIDINDIRVKLGVDWINQRNWKGFFEVGYVFDRKVVYVVNPNDSFNARNTFLAAAGFSF